MVLRLPDSGSNWNFETLVFEEREKPEYPRKNLSEQRRKPRCRDLNQGHIGPLHYYDMIILLAQTIQHMAAEKQHFDK